MSKNRLQKLEPVTKATKNKADDSDTKKAARRRTQKRTLDTREKIIAAATASFAKHGYDGASARMICDEAGVQHTLITYHFGSKEGLWQAMMSSLTDRLKKRMDERARAFTNLDDVTKLRLLFEEFIKMSALNPELHALMSHAAAKSDGRLKWLVDEVIRTNVEAWVNLIRSAQSAGRFTEGDPYVLYYTFLGAATRTYMVAGEVKQLTGRSPFTLDYVDQHIDACLRLFFRDPAE